MSDAQYPPLTATTFEPSRSCEVPILRTCRNSITCEAEVFRRDDCFDALRCHPSSDSTGPIFTYSPGYECPSSWTVAERAIPAGIWCCPSGLEWAGESPLCTGTADTNKILSESGTCGPRRSLNVFLDQPGSLTGSVWTTPDTVNNEGRYESVTIPLSDLVIHLFATAILVKEPETFDIITTTKMRNPIPPITIPRDPVTPIQTSTHPLEVTHSSKEPSNSSVYSQAPRNRGESDDLAPNGSILVGISIGATLAAVLVLGLSYLFIKRYRKSRKRRLEAHIDQGHEERIDYGVNKPELDGSQPERMKNWRKAELDANATRAELEAHVLPAELDGVPRAELEAYPTIIRMKPAKSLSITNH